MATEAVMARCRLGKWGLRAFSCLSAEAFALQLQGVPELRIDLL
jgi:hypothetical protein